VDVEEYYHVSAFEGVISRSGWATLPSRVEVSTRRLLEILGEAGVKATFFTLGVVAERVPQLVRDIVARGHEVASHGYDHTRLTFLNRESLKQDLLRAKHGLEDAGGAAVIGYRAPSFSVGPATLWALELVRDTGHLYSSSIYPGRRDLYGFPGADRFAHREQRSGLLEIPVSTIRVLNRNWPCGGGGFFRLYPYWLTRWCFRRLNEHEGRPGVFYTHPWEFDADQPRQASVSAKTRFRHYHNLHKTSERLDQLLRDFRWGPLRQVFATELS
jgi:polysaccharide deacetylase family protein (PEP-CTERM system associated)